MVTIMEAVEGTTEDTREIVETETEEGTEIIGDLETRIGEEIIVSPLRLLVLRERLKSKIVAEKGGDKEESYSESRWTKKAPLLTPVGSLRSTPRKSTRREIRRSLGRIEGSILTASLPEQGPYQAPGLDLETARRTVKEETDLLEIEERIPDPGLSIA